MCGLHAHEKQNDRSTDATKFGGGIPLPEDSTIKPLVYICVSINFMETWLNNLAILFSWCCCAYQDKIK